MMQQQCGCSWWDINEANNYGVSITGNTQTGMQHTNHYSVQLPAWCQMPGGVFDQHVDYASLAALIPKLEHVSSSQLLSLVFCHS